MQLVRSATCLYRYPSRLSRVARYDVGPDLFCVRRQGGFARLPQVNEPTVRLSLDVSRASLAITKKNHTCVCAQDPAAPSYALLRD